VTENSGAGAPVGPHFHGPGRELGLLGPLCQGSSPPVCVCPWLLVGTIGVDILLF